MQKKFVSKNFQKMVAQHEGKAFYLAPENYRDSIMMAAKLLNRTLWDEAAKEVLSLKLVSKLAEQDGTG